MNHFSTNGRPRVVVTGIGIISPLGHTAEENWDSLLNGRSGIATITQFDTSHLPVHIAGEVKDFDPGMYYELQGSTPDISRFTTSHSRDKYGPRRCRS